MGRSSTAIAREKEKQAVALALAGVKYSDIAERVGYTNRGTAHRTVMKAIRRETVQNVDELRAMEVGRIDELLIAMWPSARRGDPQAVDRVLKLMERRAKYIGGLEAPTKIEAKVESTNADEFKAFLLGAHEQWLREQENEATEADA